MDTVSLSPGEIAQTSGSNFVSSFWFLPADKRQALNVIYAYCRITDDIVDCAEKNSTKENLQNALEDWRKETMKSFQQESARPILLEVSKVAGKYKIPEDYFHQLIDGVRMDLEKKSYATFEELYPYCYHVAGVVGLICLEIFGYKNPRTKDYAVNLGVAFQLTNILRDIRADAESGRVYLPEEDLKKFSLTTHDILSLREASSLDISKFAQLVGFESRRAEHFYRKAKDNLIPEDRPNLIAAEVMCAIYYAILKKIERSPAALLAGKIELSRIELAGRAVQGWLGNRLRL